MVTFRLVALLGLALAFSAASASAGPMINFDGTTDGGTLEYDVLDGPLEGIDIIVDFLQVSGVGGGLDLNYACQSCLLNFVTGNGTESAPSIYTFGAGGSIVITGGVSAMGINNPTVLLSGFFTSIPPNVAVAGGGVGAFFGFGLDEKHPLILEFLGIDADIFRFSGTAIQASVVVEDDGRFVGTVTESDVTNSVPIPGTTLLVMLGLGGLALRRRHS